MNDSATITASLVLRIFLLENSKGGNSLGKRLNQVPFLHNYSSVLVMQITFPAEQIKGHFKKCISQPTFHRIQPLNNKTINQSWHFCV